MRISFYSSLETGPLGEDALPAGDPTLDAYKVEYVLVGRLAEAVRECSGGHYGPLLKLTDLDIDQQRMAQISSGTTSEQLSSQSGAQPGRGTGSDLSYLLLVPDEMVPRIRSLPGTRQATVTSQIFCTFDPSAFWQQPNRDSLLFLMPNIQATLRKTGDKSDSVPTGGAMFAQSNFRFNSPLIARYEAVKTTRDSQRSALTENYVRASDVGSVLKLDEDQVLFADKDYARLMNSFLFIGGLIAGLSVTILWEVLAPFLISILGAVGQRIRARWLGFSRTTDQEAAHRLSGRDRGPVDSLEKAKRVAAYRVAVRYPEDVTALEVVGEGDLPGLEGWLVRLRGARAFYDVQVTESGLTLITADFHTFPVSFE